MSTVQAIQEYIKADSLEYLTHDGMMAAVREGVARKDHEGKDVAVGHCSACMTGAYPVEFDG
jgi:glutamine phosphoribosylpyrophosphate amidotransferase